MTAVHGLGSSARVLLLDTNTLLLLLVGALDPSLLTVHKKLAAFTRRDFDLLLEILRRFGRLATTPHVLAETTNHLQMVKEPHRTRLMVLLTGAIPEMQELQEAAAHLVKSPVFERLGLTDTAVAHHAADKALTVGTTDAELYAHLQALEVDVFNIHHYRYLGVPDHL